MWKKAEAEGDVKADKSVRSSQPIDAVITWVDGADPEWVREKNRAAAETRDKRTEMWNADLSAARYRDWGTLRFLLRSLDRYAPWLRRIYLLTCGQRPAWLSETTGKLQIVAHREFMKEQDLPTFNSNAIEVNLHRIPGLAEQFIYFNDDYLLDAPVRPEDFFVNGLPKDMLALQPVVANPKNPVMSCILLNDSIVISRHFDKWETMRKHPKAYFHAGYPPMYFFYNVLERFFPLYTGFYTVHGPSPLLKSCFEELWRLEPQILAATSGHHFRSRDDVTQYLFREWQKQTGKFVPGNVKKDCAYFEISQDNSRLYRCLKRHRVKSVCINDPGQTGIDAGTVRRELLAALEQVFPEKSAYER